MPVGKILSSARGNVKHLKLPTIYNQGTGGSLKMPFTSNHSNGISQQSRGEDYTKDESEPELSIIGKTASAIETETGGRGKPLKTGLMKEEYR